MSKSKSIFRKMKLRDIIVLFLLVIALPVTVSLVKLKYELKTKASPPSVIGYSRTVPQLADGTPNWACRTQGTCPWQGPITLDQLSLPGSAPTAIQAASSFWQTYEPEIFTDDFSTDKGWMKYVDGQEYAVLGNGEYKFGSPDIDWGVYSYSPVDQTIIPASYSLEVEAHSSVETGMQAYGLVFNRKKITTDNTNAYLFSVEPITQLYFLRKWYNESWTDLSNGYSSAILTGTQTNRLRVERDGTKIRFYANGVQLGNEVEDGTILGGSVGLYARSYNNTPPSEARFDNFSLKSLQTELVQSIWVTQDEQAKNYSRALPKLANGTPDWGCTLPSCQWQGPVLINQLGIPGSTPTFLQASDSVWQKNGSELGQSIWVTQNGQTKGYSRVLPKLANGTPDWGCTLSSCQWQGPVSLTQLGIPGSTPTFLQASNSIWQKNESELRQGIWVTQDGQTKGYSRILPKLANGTPDWGCTLPSCQWDPVLTLALEGFPNATQIQSLDSFWQGNVGSAGLVQGLWLFEEELSPSPSPIPSPTPSTSPSSTPIGSPLPSPSIKPSPAPKNACQYPSYDSCIEICGQQPGASCTNEGCKRGKFRCVDPNTN